MSTRARARVDKRNNNSKTTMPILNVRAALALGSFVPIMHSLKHRAHRTPVKISSTARIGSQSLTAMRHQSEAEDAARRQGLLVASKRVSWLRAVHE